MLEAIGASKIFANARALDRLDLTVEPGEVVCLLGANGAGKSTTVNLFLGFLAPDEGEVRVAARPVLDDLAAARARIAYIPDQVSLFPLLTGAENLGYFARLAGRRLDDREAVELLTRAGLDEAAAHRKVRDYSKGMRQKVGIAIALAKEAEALLLDEPLSGLDPVAATDFGARLKELKAGNVAILMVTHDLFRAREVADRIGIMKNGRLVDMVEAETVTPNQLDRLYADHMHG